MGDHMIDESCIAIIYGVIVGGLIMAVWFAVVFVAWGTL